MRTTHLVGLDLGTSKVCCVVAEIPRDAAPLRIVGIGRANSDGLRKGEISNVNAVPDCIREACAEAERQSDHAIRGVVIGITGGHVIGVNSRGMVDLPAGRAEIVEEDRLRADENAAALSFPAETTILHRLVQQYLVDGRDEVTDPVGMHGRTIEADCHIVHGNAARIQNSVRAVKEAGLECEESIFTGLASATAVLTEEQRRLGALVLDLGAGTTEYVAFMRGQVVLSGCLAVGGDHLTNDIALGLRIPIARAEKLKLDEGSAVVGSCLPDERIYLRPEPGFAGKEVEREMLHQLIHMRLREIFELIKKRGDDEHILPYLGAGVILTGGVSQTAGIGHLTEEVFGLPVSPAQPPAISGLTTPLTSPQLSAALGLVEHARRLREEQPAPTGWRSRFGWLFGRR